MLDVVLDTVVFVRSLLQPRGPSGRIVFVHSAAYRLWLSPATRAELLEVLQRSAITRKLGAAAAVDRARLVALLNQAYEVTPATVPRVSRDPKDDVFLATAEAARADYLVSEDKDLLVLGRYGSTRIVDTASFLHILEHLNDC